MLVKNIQRSLAALYETPVAHCVSDFLVTDARVAAALEAPAQPRHNAERLLLQQTDDSLDITLFIDAAVLDALDDHDPFTSLHSHNLNHFMIALEGVSHFHYLVWNATHARQVTQLELELQAEVDKFVTAMRLFDEQGNGAAPDEVHEALFTAVSFHAELDADSDRRYREANHYAGKYCRRLARRFPAQHREPSFINELRRFYRLPQNQKIRAIETA
ncbi:MAG: hypothetical protein RLW61_22115 [Gammaproteobacteria bacterium]